MVPLVTVTAIAVPLIMNLNSEDTSAETLKEPGLPAVTTEKSPTPEPQAAATTAPPPTEETQPVETAERPAAEEKATELPFGDPIGTVRPWSWYEDSVGWLVPITAPLEDFPVDPAHDYSQGCTSDQLDWLEEHGTPWVTMSFFHVVLQNTASGGGALSLGNVRFEGEEVPAVPLVTLACEIDPAGGLVDTSPVMIHTDGRPSVWGFAFDEPDAPAEGSPVTLNLSPGEVAELYFSRHEEVDTQRHFEGYIVADVLNEETTVVLAEANFSPDEIPDYLFGYVYDDGAWQFSCVTPTSESVWPGCTPEEAANILAGLKETVG